MLVSAMNAKYAVRAGHPDTLPWSDIRHLPFVVNADCIQDDLCIGRNCSYMWPLQHCSSDREIHPYKS